MNLTFTPYFRLCLSNALFGTLNNVLYVVILSAALDLVDKATTPKGFILLANILPALVAKLGWPYLIHGAVRYERRAVSCSAMSFAGILIVAASNSLMPRLFGIAVASFSSGLGEMTFLQLATSYSLEAEESLGGVAVGWFSSGTGAAGLVGAGLWWVLRSLGVKEGLLICAILPWGMFATFHFLLPSPACFVSPAGAYSFLPVAEDDSDDEAAQSGTLAPPPVLPSRRTSVSVGKGMVALSTTEKLALARPLVVTYMVPLFFVYMAEYTINTGGELVSFLDQFVGVQTDTPHSKVAPTLIYPVPNPSTAPFLSSIIKTLRDYYPLYQLVYQTFVFFSRSSLSIFRLPPIPRYLLPLPTVVQIFLLILAIIESSTSVLSSTFGENGAIMGVLLLVSLEGISGGLAYVNVFYRLSTDDDETKGPDGETLEESGEERARRAQEREFTIASVGFADTLGILVASLVSTLVVWAPNRSGLFSDPFCPDAVAGIAARSSFVHSFTKVDSVVFEDPVVERIEVEAVADSFSLERDWTALLEEIRNSELVETNGLAIDDEGRKTHPKYVPSWNFARSIDGDLLVNTPKMAASLDFLDPNIPPRDRLNHIYFDSIPRVAALILIGPLAPTTDSPLLPPKILQAVLNLKSKSVIEETLRSNAGVVGFWLKFCDENQIPVEQRFPANPSVLLGYLATRVNQRNGEPVRSATISKDLGAIKFWHNLHGAKLEMNQAEWTMLFKGLKTVEADPLPKRRHLLVEDLHAVHDRLNFDNAFDVAFWAATLAGFFGMMRSGEFTTPNTTHFNPKIHVSSENIKYAEKYGDENPENFRIHLPWDQTNKALGRDVGIIASSPDETVDPILALKLHLACNAPPPNMGLFSYRLRDKSGHRQLTKSAWRNRMNVCLLAAGREPISGHKVRIGGCNYYVQLKMKHSTIQKLCSDPKLERTLLA